MLPPQSYGKNKMSYEHKSESLIPLLKFIKRILNSLGLILCLIIISLSIGILGYRISENMSWIDSFYNASLILSGMGPATELKTDAGKIFASLYALYSGIIIIAASGILLAPLFHRMIHKFHIEKE